MVDVVVRNCKCSRVALSLVLWVGFGWMGGQESVSCCCSACEPEIIAAGVAQKVPADIGEYQHANICIYSIYIGDRIDISFKYAITVERLKHKCVRWQ